MKIALYEPLLKQNETVAFAFSDNESFWKQTDHVRVYTLKRKDGSMQFRAVLRVLTEKNGIKTN